MAQEKKVIYVDFMDKRKGRPFVLGGGPRFTVTAFFLFLVVFVAAVGLSLPGSITTPFFGPTAILVSVLFALGAKRALIALQMNKLKRTIDQRDREEARNRTIH